MNAYSEILASVSQIPPVPAPGNEKRKHSEDSDADDGDEAPVRKRAVLPRRPCIICADDVPKNRFPKIPHKQDESNRHGSDVCFKCYRQHLGVEIKNKGHEAVSCPQCSKTLHESEVRKLASSRTYQEYIDKVAKNCMQQDEEYHSCPNAKCPWGAFFAKDDGNILNCRMCKARYCLDCEIPFHEGQTCEEYQADATRRTEEEQKSLETVKNTSRPCPNPTCGVNIDKYSGCDHVTCRRCRHEFCWECFAPYNGPQGIWQMGNSAHRMACRYAPRSLPEYRAPLLSDDEGDY